jgi:hypothetical protein
VSFKAYRWVMELTFTEVLDPLTVDRLAILVNIGHQETPKVLLHGSSDLVDCDPLSD